MRNAVGHNFTWSECIPQLGIQVDAGFVQVNEEAGAGKNQSLEWDNDRAFGGGLHRMRGCTVQILPKDVADKNLIIQRVCGPGMLQREKREMEFH